MPRCDRSCSHPARRRAASGWAAECDSAARVEQAREEGCRRRVDAERTRIARELHDVTRGAAAGS
jgi:signal transduction histidine kinase